jgi:hypothetical protein
MLGKDPVVTQETIKSRRQRNAVFNSPNKEVSDPTLRSPIRQTGSTPADSVQSVEAPLSRAELLKRYSEVQREVQEKRATRDNLLRQKAELEAQEGRA